jgi:hypothetical protein
MPSIFYCEKCDFNCSKQSIYNKHLSTAKHKHNGYISGYLEIHDTNYILSEKCPKNNRQFVCSCCLKSYKYHSGLWRHKKECSDINDFNNQSENEVVHSPAENFIVHKSALSLDQISNTQIKNLTHENREMKKNMKMMMQMMANNTQFQSQIIEMMKTSSKSFVASDTTPSSIPAIASSGDNAIINSNNNNNTFNMNLFLNEKCKDAMNMKDFVNSIQLDFTDMENVGRLGYVEGMSNILIDNLQKTDVYKRPVHCSDVKRETLYVKDDNKWEREGPNHPKMVNAVLAVEQKNVALVSEWAKAHPSCMNSHTRDNDKYFKLSKAVTDGEKDGNIAKVIRRVSKNVSIDKE